MPLKLCSLGDGKPARKKGWCFMHYSRWKRHGDPLIVKKLQGDDGHRFRLQVDTSGGPDACHPFIGTINNRGYGTFHLGGRQTKAHIYAFVLANAAVPDGHEVDHRCHVPDECALGDDCPHRRCCNQRHLQALTHRANILRGSCTKLTDDVVASLHERWLAGETKAALGREVGVAGRTLTVRFGRLFAEAAS